MAKRKPTPKKKKSDPSVYLWEQKPEQIRKLFATFGEIERRWEDDEDLFMIFLDPDGKLREEYGEEIDKQREVIQAIVGLQTYGSTGVIREAQGILQMAAAVLNWLHRQPSTRWDKDSPGEAGNKVLEEVIRLNHVQMMAESYEETLRQHGLKFDSELMMAVPLGGRGRPSLFINRICGTMAIVLKDTYQTPDERNKEIYRRLSRFFPIPEEDAGPRGKIARASENALREAHDRPVRNNRRKGRNPA